MNIRKLAVALVMSAALTVSGTVVADAATDAPCSTSNPCHKTTGPITVKLKCTPGQVFWSQWLCHLHLHTPRGCCKH